MMTALTNQIIGDVRQSWAKLLVAGLCATIVQTLMFYFVAPMMTGSVMDIAHELGAIVGMPWVAGMVAHLGLGIVVFPLVYVAVLRRWLPGPPAVRGLIWGLLLWLIAMLVFSPMIGRGLFMGGPPPAMASLIAHAVYGGLLGAIAGAPARRY